VVYFYLYTFRQHRERQKILNWKVVNIFKMFISECNFDPLLSSPKYFNFAAMFKALLAKFILPLYLSFWWWEMNILSHVWQTTDRVWTGIWIQWTLRVRAHQGNWQLQRNRNFRELLSAWAEHMSLNGAAQIEETATVSMWQVLEVIYFYIDILLPLFFCGICFYHTTHSKMTWKSWQLRGLCPILC
jgi:hypothetical protein